MPPTRRSFKVVPLAVIGCLLAACQPVMLPEDTAPRVSVVCDASGAYCSEVSTPAGDVQGLLYVLQEERWPALEQAAAMHRVAVAYLPAEAKAALAPRLAVLQAHYGVGPSRSMLVGRAQAAVAALELACQLEGFAKVAAVELPADVGGLGHCPASAKASLLYTHSPMPDEFLFGWLAGLHACETQFYTTQTPLDEKEAMLHLREYSCKAAPLRVLQQVGGLPMASAPLAREVMYFFTAASHFNAGR